MKRYQAKIKSHHQIKCIFGSWSLKHLHLVPIISYCKCMIETFNQLFRLVSLALWCGGWSNSSAINMLMFNAVVDLFQRLQNGGIHRSGTCHSVIDVSFKCWKRFSDQNYHHLQIKRICRSPIQNNAFCSDDFPM